MKKTLYLLFGGVSLGIGILGTMVPILPTFPFLMMAAFCFAQSSKKLHSWFIHTKLYRENLADYVEGKGMTRKAKLRIMTTVTFMMSIGFIVMKGKGLKMGCILLGCVWLFHLVYFIFGIKTIHVKEVTG